MRKMLYLSLIGSLLLACETEPQYFTESPEIELFKATVDAYVNGDWETMSSSYADTAQIYHNIWREGNGMSVDEAITIHQESRQNLSSVSVEGWEAGSEPIYEMVVQDDGDKWVLVWCYWTGTLAATGEQVSVPIHISAKIAEGKIGFESAMFDTGPLSQKLAQIAADEAAEMEGEEMMEE